MGEEETATVSILPSSLHKKSSSFSTSIRFLGFLKQPDSDSTADRHLELDERDVIWPSHLSPDLSFAVDSEDLYSPEPSPTNDRDRRRPVRPLFQERYGLSAALADDRLCPAVDPARPTSTAVRIVPAAWSGEEEGFRKPVHQSAPVNVPAWPRRRGQGFDALDEVGDGEEEGEDGEMMPPHVIVARSHVTTFSVFEGVGRTLKGRDLRRVRNAVWRQTGFLD